MRWICILFPRLSLEALAPPADVSVAVFEQSGSRRWVHQLNDLARERGASVGMALPSAQGLIPDLVCLPRKPEAETEALHSAATWAYRFGSPVTHSIGQHAIWVEVEQSIEVFGGWRPLAQALAHRENGPPYTRRHGVAPTLAASYLLATAGAGLRHAVERIEDLPKAIQGLPLGLLPFPPEALKVLHGSGLRRIGDVLAIPAHALGRRIGKPALLSLQRLLGESAEVWLSYQPPGQYPRPSTKLRRPDLEVE